MIKMLRKILRKLVEYPIWAYALECEVCKMSFGDAKLHYDAVLINGNKEAHKNKIPILRRGKK